MWILLDNYDSFTYILLHYLQQTGNECVVYRNDELSVTELAALNPERIIISPGPETPLQAGITMDVIEHFHKTTPILGVCLGHQALGMYFGGKLVHTPYPMHGKTSEVTHNDHPLYNNIPSPCTVMRYHSLAIDEIENTGLIPLAHTVDDNTLMALAHETYPCVGIQYHPESIGTNDGQQLINNWAKMY
ncbi:MAG: aminodeoxychorismate/anthranilate synthase component II [Chitinophagales bacterium]|nr:aminodeoxychorismate/anthranilate synthase component II [Chitinophagaceae bacterium]MCB9063673.1 aminodeoxychorismate/anthranilate synthase component II [Chitinophagales bacterium]